MANRNIVFGDIHISEDSLIEIIQASPIFLNLRTKDYRKLISLSELTFLNKDEYLFFQGEISDCMYILVYGQLVALLKVDLLEKFVGMIKAGETVGELGVFSNKPRSLTLKASQPSVLLKIARPSILEFWKAQNSAEFHMQMIDAVISRSQSVIKLLAEEKLYRHVAIVPANDQPIPREFIIRLKKKHPEITPYFISR